MRPRNRRQPGRPRLPVDCRQNNVTAVSVRHCAATTALRNCCPNCYAEQIHKDNVRSSAVGKQLKQKKSSSLSFLAQHPLPALDLFWASFFLRVQLTSLDGRQTPRLTRFRQSRDPPGVCVPAMHDLTRREDKLQQTPCTQPLSRNRRDLRDVLFQIQRMSGMLGWKRTPPAAAALYQGRPVWKSR